MRALLGGLTLLAVMGSLACNGALRFDDQQTSDGGSDQCPGDNCTWKTETCGATSCALRCEGNAVCAGSCGASCSGHCEEESHCTLTAGKSASVECERGAICELVLGPSGSVDCQDGSTCRVRCLGDCSVSCSSASSCELQCGAAAARVITDSADCP